MTKAPRTHRWAEAVAALDRALRKPVLERYARLEPSGHPMTCKPSSEERHGGARREPEGTDYKVIFNNKEAAEAAAVELHRLGARPMRAYPCKRSRHGHYHLGSERS